MKKSDIIIVSDTSNDEYDSIVEDAVKYSLISFPFTTDRMKIPNQKKRVINIAKGKIAEGLFKWYCNNNNINVNFETCETPFWQVDKRDFMLNGYEWDIKNNILYLEGDYSEDILNLPALIPSRNRCDQWSTKDSIKISKSRGVKHLFTFLKGAELKDGERRDPFFDINLSKRQADILQKCYKKYKGLPTKSEPFVPKVFWDYFLKSNTDLFTVFKRPKLVITGFADKTIWNLFKETGPNEANNYINHVSPYWYKKIGRRNSLSWYDGVLWTKITNMTLPVCYLKSFSNEIIGKI